MGHGYSSRLAQSQQAVPNPNDQFEGQGIVGGLMRGGKELLGLVGDIATAPWRDDDDPRDFYETFRDQPLLAAVELLGRSIAGPVTLGRLSGHTTAFEPDDRQRYMQRLSGAVGSTLGEESGLGAVPGFWPLMEAIETGSRELVHEPIATGATAAGLSTSNIYQQSQGQNQLSLFIDPGTWKEAHALAQSRSPGQSIIAMLATKDILNPDEINELIGSDWYRWATGSLDALIRLRADVDILAAKGLSMAKARYLYPNMQKNKVLRDYFFDLAGKEDLPLDFRIASGIVPGRYKWDQSVEPRIARIYNDVYADEAGPAMKTHLDELEEMETGVRGRYEEVNQEIDDLLMQEAEILGDRDLYQGAVEQIRGAPGMVSPMDRIALMDIDEALEIYRRAGIEEIADEDAFRYFVSRIADDGAWDTVPLYAKRQLHGDPDMPDFQTYETIGFGLHRDQYEYVRALKEQGYDAVPVSMMDPTGGLNQADEVALIPDEWVDVDRMGAESVTHYVPEFDAHAFTFRGYTSEDAPFRFFDDTEGLQSQLDGLRDESGNLLDDLDAIRSDIERAKNLDPEYVNRVIDADPVRERTIGRIRDELFPDDPNGADKARMLALPGSPESRKVMGRLLYGDPDAIEYFSKFQKELDQYLTTLTGWESGRRRLSFYSAARLNWWRNLIDREGQLAQLGEPTFIFKGASEGGVPVAGLDDTRTVWQRYKTPLELAEEGNPRWRGDPNMWLGPHAAYGDPLLAANFGVEMGVIPSPGKFKMVGEEPGVEVLMADWMRRHMDELHADMGTRRPDIRLDMTPHQERYLDELLDMTEDGDWTNWEDRLARLRDDMGDDPTTGAPVQPFGPDSWTDPKQALKLYLWNLDSEATAMMVRGVTSELQSQGFKGIRYQNWYETAGQRGDYTGPGPRTNIKDPARRAAAGITHEQDSVLFFNTDDWDQLIQARTSQWQEINTTLEDMASVNRTFDLVEDLNMRSFYDDWGRDFHKFDLRNSPDRLIGLDAEIQLVRSHERFLQNIENVAATQDRLLRPTLGGAVRRQITQSDWYMSRTGRPIRVFFQMKPHHIADLNDRTNVDVMLTRMLHESGMDPGDVDKWRGRLIEQQSRADRFTIWEQAEEAAFKSVADEFGLSESAVKKALERIRQGRGQAKQFLDDPKSRAYSIGGRDWIRYVDDDGNASIIAAPMSASQVRSYVATPDFQKLRASLKHAQSRGLIGRIKGTKAGDIADETLNMITYYWKAAVLLRPGWTAKVVLLDEQLRMMSKFGAMATMKQWPKKMGHLAARYADELGLAHPHSPTAQQNLHKWRNRAAAAGAGAGYFAGGPLGAAVGGTIGGGAVHALAKAAKIEDAGFGHMMLAGQKVTAFDQHGIYKDKVSQTHDVLEEFLVEVEQQIRKRVKGTVGSEGTLRGVDAGYEAAWKRVLSRQVAQDPLWRQALEGKTPEEMLNWLETTPAGMRYLELLPHVRSSAGGQIVKGGDIRGYTGEQIRNGDAFIPQKRLDHLQSMHEYAWHLVNNDPDIAARVLANDAGGAWEQLTKVAPDAGLRPEVHGQIVDVLSPKSQLWQAIDNIIHKGYRLLGGAPTDTLSRNPTFSLFFKEKMESMIAAVGDAKLSKRQIEAMERSARDYALGHTRRVLFDLAERSQFGDMVRFLIPFFNAGQEVLSRWAGLIVEKPHILAIAKKVWESPEKAGWQHTDPETGNEYLVFRVPEVARNLVNAVPRLAGALDSQGYATIAKDSLSTIPMLSATTTGEALDAATRGMFGFGPFVQLAVGEIIKARPEMEESLEWAAPYGIPKARWEAFAPAWVKRFNASVDENDRAYTSTVGNIIKTKLTQAAIERGGMAPMTEEEIQEMVKEAEEEAKALFKLRTIANFAMPAAPTFQTPYMPYIQEYQRIHRELPAINLQRNDQGLPDARADEIFYSMYGEEFFALTQSMSRVNDGIPATMGAHAARERYKDMIEKYPDWGGVIVGDEAGGEQAKFSSAMYARQLGTEVREGSGIPQRERLSSEEIATSPQVRLARIKYSRWMDLIEAERIRRGLPNLQVKEAQDLAETKRLMTKALEQQHPQWAAERSQIDLGRWDRLIEGARAVASDDRLANRDDIQGLRQYLNLRDQVMAQLAARSQAGGAKTLAAKANMDLQQAFSTGVSGIIHRYPAFADLYHRMLDNDPVTLDTLGLPDRKAA